MLDERMGLETRKTLGGRRRRLFAEYNEDLVEAQGMAPGTFSTGKTPDTALLVNTLMLVSTSMCECPSTNVMVPECTFARARCVRSFGFRSCTNGKGVSVIKSSSTDLCCFKELHTSEMPCRLATRAAHLRSVCGPVSDGKLPTEEAPRKLDGPMYNKAPSRDLRQAVVIRRTN